MLGSWSLGAYPHEHSLRWGWKLLTEGFGVDPRMVSVTVFGGDERCDRDIRSEQVCSELGLPPERIVPLITENWWTGPGRHVRARHRDVRVDRRRRPRGEPSPMGAGSRSGTTCRCAIATNDGGLVELPRRCVDTGMGLERTLMVLQGRPSVFGTDVFQPWMTHAARPVAARPAIAAPAGRPSARQHRDHRRRRQAVQHRPGLRAAAAAAARAHRAVARPTTPCTLNDLPVRTDRAHARAVRAGRGERAGPRRDPR